MDQIALQRSLKSVSLDDPRIKRITEIDKKGTDASEEEKEEMLRLILLLKKELPSK
jgi:hypothetical protein